VVKEVDAEFTEKLVMSRLVCKKRAQREMKPLVHQVLYAESYEQRLRQGRELIARFKNNY